MADISATITFEEKNIIVSLVDTGIVVNNPAPSTSTSVKYLEGADPTGATDSSAAFAAVAISDVVGTVHVAPGIYKVAHIPIRNGLTWQGPGRDAGLLIQPDSGGGHFFEVKSAITLSSGGVKGFSATGNATTINSFDGTVDFVNLSAATICYQFIMAENYVEKCRAAFYGSQNDREPRLHNNTIWYNNYGVFIQNNHPLFTGVNDIRLNNYGITGLVIYDMTINGQKLVSNNYGIVPQVSGAMSNVDLCGCDISFNYILGAQFDNGCSITGGKLFAGSSGTFNRGVLIRGEGNAIRGTHIQSFGQPFTVGAVCFANTSAVKKGNSVQHCDIGYSGSGNSVGTAITHESGSMSQYGLQITNNQMYFKLATDRFINLLGPVIVSNISHNFCQSDPFVVTTDIIDVNNGGCARNQITNNTSFTNPSSTGHAIRAWNPGGFNVNNIARRGAGFQWNGSDADTVSTPNIYVP
jgi:hypothetical protein